MAGKPSKIDNELPKQIEKILAATAMYFGQAGKTPLQRIVVNARSVVEENISWDNWDGGQAGHRVHLQIPAELYYPIIPNRQDIEQQLAQMMNQIVRIEHEQIDDVVIELQDSTVPPDWRDRSGLVIRASPELSKVSDDDISRLWEPGLFRVFLSHKSDFKTQAHLLKKSMLFFGVTCFVAHDDIEPTREWQLEIEKALFSTECLVALLTENFHNSNWTDQEIGIAIGRGVPVIPVRRGTDPYGFIGKYQGLTVRGKNVSEAAKSLFDLLWSKTEFQPRLAECLVPKLAKSTSFADSNAMMEYFLKLPHLPKGLVERIETAAASNPQVGAAYKVNDELPKLREKAV